ncbi:hypothetical protein KK083_29345 [Fulvivirgaceae bacterium PWU4]|uniref:Uncharacterized protein n=1 Tax=Chryseosolibacter histidini TaxID=2782349 RepID=A0AAP2GMA2_9BACT|nr:hypothetical protein [Chryseosolibacter histidini]MBT1701034.1 hypothetical protein [Chryseosolibacter histidini]
MTDTREPKIKQLTMICYLTVILAALQSIFEELMTTDFAHRIFSTYFFIEVAILVVLLGIGLKNEWTRVILALFTFWEVVLFIQEKPISPDEVLMIIIFALRVYVLVRLFSGAANRYYKAGK